MSAPHYSIPRTPTVISPSPTPSEQSASRDGYFQPVTRGLSKALRSSTSSSSIREDQADADSDDRARSRSRSPQTGRKPKIAPLTPSRPHVPTTSGDAIETPRKGSSRSVVDGRDHLQPPPRSYWRDLSRSPSPLGLIPIHTRFRQFIHRNEIPRKSLHVSIGFLTTWLYTHDYQTDDIYPVLMTVLIPIATVDVLRHRWRAFNRLYIRLLGPLMRESEVDGYNGVIWYLLGAWAVLKFCPKDVGTVSVLLLSWCDTAASTFGRLYGKYTPKIRRGKSLAGSLAAMLCGVATALFFWGYAAPKWGNPLYSRGVYAFAFQGRLTLPGPVRRLLGSDEVNASITGPLALGVLSLWTGFIASASEAVDLFNWDDNLTIPVLCGVGLWGFLATFT